MDNKSQGKFICIYRTPYYSQIVGMKSLLDAHKISYFIENENFAFLRSSDGVSNGSEWIFRRHKEIIERFNIPRN